MARQLREILVALLLLCSAACNGFSSFSTLKTVGKSVEIENFSKQQPRQCYCRDRDRCIAANNNNAPATALAMTSYLESLVTTIADTAVKAESSPKPRAHYDSMICGGGPAGLLTAIMLSKKYGPSHRIAVCERRSTKPPSPADKTVWNDVARFYCLGIGHRGQKALKQFGVFDDFVKASVAVNGRRDWQPGMTRAEDGKITPAKKEVVSRVLPRDKLVSLLHHHIVDNYADANIDLLYGYELEPESFGNENASEKNDNDLVTVRISKCDEELPATKETPPAGVGTAKSSSSSSYIASQDSDPLCDVESFQISQTKLLIAADGSARTVANAMERHDAEKRSRIRNPLVRSLVSPKPFQVTRFVDDNVRVYKSVPIRLPPDWPRDLNYSARARENRITLEALPSDDQGNLCALLLMKPNDEFAQSNTDPEKLREYFNQEFPQFSVLIGDDEMALLAKKPTSALPAFRYAGPRLNCEKRTLVLGDAAHTVKPYYGLGANTALEDVQFLSDALDDAAAAAATTGGDDKATPEDSVLQTAVKLFSDRRAGDCEALVTISRNMDRSGKLFYVNFLLPLILDGIFHKLAPKVFGPNIFAMFKRPNITFQQIRRKKRLDRALQVACISTLLTGVGLGTKAVLHLLARITGKSQGFMSVALATIVAFGVTVRRKVSTQTS